MNIRTRRLVLAASVVAFVLASTGVMAGGEVNLLYGKKELDLGWPPLPGDASPDDQRRWSGLVDDLEDQTQWGIMFSFGHDWPVALAIDYLDGKGDAGATVSYLGYNLYRFDAEVRTQELDLGVRKFWGNKFQGYLGGGAAVIRGKTEVKTEFLGVVVPALSGDASDTGIGFFLDGGVVWRAGNWFNLGADVRYSNAKADLLVPNWNASTINEILTTGSTDVGGFSYGIFVGGRW